jgi:neutral ceramidase
MAYDLKQTTLPITLSAVRIGDVVLLFHPAELYSYYGLAMQRDSHLKHIFVIGYADGYVGYVTDPKAYERSEYAASMVPTILNYPPFTATAGREMAHEAIKLRQRIASLQ